MMKVLICVSLLVLAVYSAVVQKPAVISPVDSEELDPLTAATLETLERDDDSDDDSNEINLDELEDDDNLDDEQVIRANVTDDGMIQVEDMVVSPDMFQVLFPHVKDHPDNSDSQTVHRRAAVSSSSKLWPNARVPYAYNRNLAVSQSSVKKAMNEWQQYTCIKFEYRKSSDKAYLQIRTKTDSRGNVEKICSATVGYTKRLQYVNLGPNCKSHPVILHELGHALGLIHEHQHPDRDKYVTIVWNNINPKKVSNFKPKTSGVSTYGIRYDPTSIMHYSKSLFRKDGCKSPCDTIVSKQGSAVTKTMGRSQHLSKKSDIPIINKMYCGRKG